MWGISMSKVTPLVFEALFYVVCNLCAIFLLDSGSEGNVLVISNTGKLLKTVTTPGPEISGLAIW